MRVKIGKLVTLTAFSLMRQGERSIDFSLSSQQQWSLLREYYAGEKTQDVTDLLTTLTAVQPCHRRTYDKTRLGKITVAWIVSYPYRVWLNRWRDQWSFSSDEVAFIIDTLSRLVTCLMCEEQPSPELLVELRRDLHWGQRIIQLMLTGCSFITLANHMEHFCQSDQATFYSLRELIELASS